jgi:hypothetical protein
VLMRGVQCGTLYKLLGRTLSQKRDHVVASKTGAYWRKGPVNTTW